MWHNAWVKPSAPLDYTGIRSCTLRPHIKQIQNSQNADGICTTIETKTANLLWKGKVGADAKGYGGSGSYIESNAMNFTEAVMEIAFTC